MYIDNQTNYIKEKSMKIQTGTKENKSEIVWKVLNEITGRKDRKQDKLKKENPEKGLKIWKEHFEKLLGQPAINTTPSLTCAIIGHILPTNTNNFTIEELNKTIEQLPTNKVSGPDDILADAWESCILLETLATIFNQTLNLDKPDMWSKGDIPFPKKAILAWQKIMEELLLPVF